MYCDKISDFKNIAKRTSCAIFVLPENTKLEFKNATYLAPDQSKTTATITVDQLRDFTAQANSREQSDRFFIVQAADTMNEIAQNAFLKTIEEPHMYCHFILIVQNPHSLLPTIRSRAEIFYLKHLNVLDQPPAAKPRNLELAKKLISAPPKDLPALALEITKSKSTTRNDLLNLVQTSVELLYKSYFKTGNQKFLTKLPNFLNLYESLSKNGHIKLHIIADLC